MSSITQRIRMFEEIHDDPGNTSLTKGKTKVGNFAPSPSPSSLLSPLSKNEGRAEMQNNDSIVTNDAIASMFISSTNEELKNKLESIFLQGLSDPFPNKENVSFLHSTQRKADVENGKEPKLVEVKKSCNVHGKQAFQESLTFSPPACDPLKLAPSFIPPKSRPLPATPSPSLLQFLIPNGNVKPKVPNSISADAVNEYFRTRFGVQHSNNSSRSERIKSYTEEEESNDINYEKCSFDTAKIELNDSGNYDFSASPEIYDKIR